MDAAIGSEKSVKATRNPISQALDHNLKTNVFWAKLSRWEFWPFGVFYFPVMFYCLWLSIRNRSFFFFTASNPSIEFGGMLGESKNKIFDLIPNKYIPKTYLLHPNIDSTNFLDRLKKEKLAYPFILKPDIGERGWMVSLIQNEVDLIDYLEEIEVDFLVQEYVSYPIELGIFYYRYPDCDRGTVSSIVMKDMLSVVGNGINTVEELMQEDVRAKMHLENFRFKKPDLLSKIPVNNEYVELNAIGNHSLGTTFLTANHLIDHRLIKLFDQVSKEIDGFYFGRYDIRCQSVEDLYEGRHFKILELNGAGSEPAHIYQPGFPLLQAYTDIIHHLKVLAEISRINKKRGVDYMNFRQGIREILKIRKYNRQKK